MNTTLETTTLATAALCLFALVSGCKNGLDESDDFPTVAGDESDATGASEEEDTASAQSAVTVGSLYRIRNVQAGLCMALGPTCHPNGADACLSNPVLLDSCNSPLTQWEIAPGNSGALRLRHVVTQHVILMAGPSTENGSPAILFTNTTGASPNRDFLLEASGADTCIKSVYSGRYLTYPGNTVVTDPLGVLVYQYGMSCAGDAWKWRFEAL